MEIEAKRVDGFDDLKEPGDFILTSRIGIEADTGLLFVCPCGCGEFGGVSFDVPEADGLSGPKWTWNGDRDRPTIASSIRRVGGCGWHGFLNDGVFRSC